MFQLPKPTSRKALIITHDLLATVAAIVASFYIRFEDQGLGSRLEGLLVVLPGFVAYAGIVYYFFRLYEGKWRVASLPHPLHIFRAASLRAASRLVPGHLL